MSLLVVSDECRRWGPSALTAKVFCVKELASSSKSGADSIVVRVKPNVGVVVLGWRKFAPCRS